MSRTDQTQRSRFVRSIVLECLASAARAGNRLGFSYQQLRDGFAASRVDITDAEVRYELQDLTGGGLVEEEWDADLQGHYYTLAKAGMDFVRAGMPWDLLDKFTGGAAR